MREAHAHIAEFGQSLSLPRVDECTGLAECLERLRAAVGAAGPGNWVRLLNARVESWPERRWPTLAELDKAAPENPCVIMSFDHHAAAANSAALAAAGLKAGKAVPPNGIVCADSKGKATGALLEEAAYAAWRAAPEPTAAQRESHIKKALAAFMTLGFTQVHDMHSQDWLGPALGKLDRTGALEIEVWLYPPVASIRPAFESRHTFESARVRLAGAKAFADGTLNSRTAFVLGRYAQPLDGMPHGKAMMRDRDLFDTVQLVESLDPRLHLAVHAIGDGAVRTVLDVLKRASKRRGEAGEKGGRHRIEHCELIDKADVPRFAEQQVVCSVQPCHLLTDIPVLTRQLPDRLHRVLPLRELIDAGCTPGDLLWFGSDAPIVRPDPEDSIQAAVHRRPKGVPESAAVAIEQRVTEEEATACFDSGRPIA